MIRPKWYHAEEQTPAPFETVLVVYRCAEDAPSPVMVSSGYLGDGGEWVSHIFGERITDVLVVWQPIVLPQSVVWSKAAP